MIRTLLCILSLSFFSLSASHKFEVSICAIFQNEAPYLKEWIEFHRLLGVEHFWLYNNSSSDNYLEVVNPYVEKGIVELIDWPSPVSENWLTYQREAYNDCISRSKARTRWLAVIDIDEFIVPVYANSLKELLKQYRGTPGIQIRWQSFGTSNLFEVPQEKTQVESLLYKALPDATINRDFKTICRPSYVKTFHIHIAEYISPYSPGGYEYPILSIDHIRIHHYWTRDEKYFREKKVPRRVRLEGLGFTEEKIQSIFDEMNQVRDETIIRFVPALRQRLDLPVVSSG